MIEKPTFLRRPCKVFLDDVQIGVTNLYNADAPMGVAMGVFHPTEAYLMQTHAHECATGRTKAPADTFVQVRSGDDRLSLKYYLVDFSDELPDADARELHIFFPDWQIYDAFFEKGESFDPKNNHDNPN